MPWLTNVTEIFSIYWSNIGKGESISKWNSIMNKFTYTKRFLFAGRIYKRNNIMWYTVLQNETLFPFSTFEKAYDTSEKVISKVCVYSTIRQLPFHKPYEYMKIIFKANGELGWIYRMSRIYFLLNNWETEIEFVLCVENENMY